ncbi:MAG: membrane protein insertion efficiency factor YidD [bacterium]
MFKKIIEVAFFLPRLPILGLIKLYQKTLSPDHGLLQFLFPHGYCRFHPSCSEYGYQIIKKTGLIKGLFKGSWRVLRCNPWNKGGVDLP